MDEWVRLTPDESREFSMAAAVLGAAAERYRKAHQETPDPGPEEKIEAARALTRASDSLDAIRSRYEGKKLIFWAEQPPTSST